MPLELGPACGMLRTCISAKDFGSGYSGSRSLWKLVWLLLCVSKASCRVEQIAVGLRFPPSEFY